MYKFVCMFSSQLSQNDQTDQDDFLDKDYQY